MKLIIEKNVSFHSKKIIFYSFSDVMKMMLVNTVYLDIKLIINSEKWFPIKIEKTINIKV